MRRRPCSQIPAPPHTLHTERRRPCGQAPHTLHFERGFTPCSHGPKCFGALFRFVPLFVNSSLHFSLTSTSLTFTTLILTRGRQIVVIPIASSARPRSESFVVDSLYKSSSAIPKILGHSRRRSGVNGRRGQGPRDLRAEGRRCGRRGRRRGPARGPRTGPEGPQSKEGVALEIAIPKIQAE